MSPDQYCQLKAAQSGSSFYFSFRFLPHEQRNAMMALYAFCREVDDIVDDNTLSPSAARKRLDTWRNAVTKMFSGEAEHPIMQAMMPHIHAFSLEKRHLLALIDGMEMDLDKTRYATFDELENYCWHVAGTVGNLAARIFGVTQAKTIDYAEKLGLAFQLTNIIRDVGEDAQRERIYLPSGEMDRFGVTEGDIRHRHETPAFRQLMAFQTERALALYEDAFSLLPVSDRTSQKPGLMMAAVYRELLLKIRHEHFPVLTRRVSLGKSQKIWLTLKAWLHD